MRVDEEQKHAVGVDDVPHVAQPDRHAPAAPDAAPERAPVVGVDEAGRVYERLHHGASQPVADPGKNWRVCTLQKNLPN